jgi:hypothetical protein
MKLVSEDSNNGEKTVLLGPASSFNLIGNPYPSAIDIDLFLGKCCFIKGNSISVVIIHLLQIKCIQLIMPFIIYWEELGQVLQKM